MISGVQGGNFWTGFASGALSSIAATAFGGSSYKNADGSFTRDFGGLNGSIGGGDIGTLAFGTVMGGAGATLTGGNFWQGAATGLTVSLLNHAAHKTGDNDSMFDDVQTQEKDIDFVELFEKVMSNKVGTILTADQIIKKYNLPVKLKSAINSMKLVSKNEVYVDWNNEGKINTLSKINVKDGVLSINRGFVPSKPGAKLGSNGYIISGGGLNYQPSLWSSESFSPVFVTRTGIYGYFPKTNTMTSEGAGF